MSAPLEGWRLQRNATGSEHVGCANDSDEMLRRNWYDADDWPSEFSFREMQEDLHRPAPSDGGSNP